MIYPESASEKLGYQEIKELLREQCLSPMGKALAAKIMPLSDLDKIRKFLLQSKEMKEILEHDSPLPLDHFYPLRELAEQSKVEGSFLQEEAFFQMLLSLRSVFGLLRYFQQRETRYPSLQSLRANLHLEPELLRNIEVVIDDKGQMRADASALYQRLFADITQGEREVFKRIDVLYKQAQKSGWTAEGSLTVREGRLCIPVLAEHKRKIKGFVHDESSSGQTVFIEPAEVLELNNRIRDLQFEQRREKMRILIQLTQSIRPFLPALLAYHKFLGQVDFIRGKALLAIALEAEMPRLSDRAEVQLNNARHPLLWLNFRKENQTVVPLHIKIDARQRIVVVSGPNAGGKSVVLKTVGLLQMMAQSGLLIPADEDSVSGVFKHFFADIGDDQSLESDLSTYSAHLSKMRYFLQNASPQTLILIDEFGTGTDPQFGGPMAEAVLQVLNEKDVRGVITTHYSNLKIFASATPGIENASMQFDQAAMQAQYILEVGKPGSSYAFEIAYKIGLPKKVLQLAREKVGIHQKKVDHLLVDLEKEKKQLQELKNTLSRQEKQLRQQQEETQSLENYLETNKNSILKQARLEAKQILNDANKLVENTISEIKSNQAEKTKTRKVREKLTAAQQRNQAEAPEPTPQKPTPQVLQIGDKVRLTDTGTEGEVIDISRDNVVLAMGALRSVVKRNRVERIGKAGKAISRASAPGGTPIETAFYPELDVRGMRTEAALAALEKHFDRALMLGIPSLKIIHGKGDGILRKMIREYLKKYDQVQRMEDEHPDRGGAGITYVYF